MITSRTARTLTFEVPSGAHISPEHYQQNTTLLKPLRPPFRHKQPPAVSQPTAIDAELARHQQVPGVGHYDPVQAEYTRGPRLEHAVFASVVERFPEAPVEEVEIAEPEHREPVPIKPPPGQKIPTLKQVSIPTKLIKTADCSPAPNEYRIEPPELPRADTRIVPVTGGSALTRYLHQSPWALAKDGQKPTSSVGPGEYDVRRQLKLQKQGPVYETAPKPVTAITDALYSNTDSLEGRLKAQQKKQQSLQAFKNDRQLQVALGAKLHPTIGPAAYEPQKRIEIKPEPGQYYIEQMEKDDTVAQNKLALARFANLDKWPQVGTSVPLKDYDGIARDVVRLEQQVETKEEKKPGLLEMQRDRKTQPWENKQTIQGDYNIAQQKTAKIYSKAGTAPFASKTQKPEESQLKQREKEEALREQLVRKRAEIETEHRAAGGLGTDISYQLARMPPTTKIYNNIGTDRELKIVHDVPPPDRYEIRAVPEKMVKINANDRATLGEMPLKNLMEAGRGPSLHRAVQKLAERRVAETIVGPGMYNAQFKQKRSFNALVDENKIE